MIQSGGFSADFGDPAFPWQFAGSGFFFEMVIKDTESAFWGPFDSCFEGCLAGDPVERPFTFSGHITAFTDPELSGSPVFDWDLTGVGTVGVILGDTFFRDEDGRPTGQPGPLAFHYTFGDAAAAPVPEPSTLLLIGTALAGAAARRRRRANRR